MSDITNPLQNTSYTNKDFTSVYTELLDLVKDLTSMWDPSISNESDPGVILLKLNAIIADKLSYNSDTNILEAFPLSVTQEKNARQLFEQLGYYMHWYKAATTDVSISWTGEKDADKEYTIPAFTMVSDYNNSIIYTLVGPVTPDGSFAVNEQKLKLDGSTTSFKAIQGIPVELDINGETLITINHLDDDNRIYFPSFDIAENGIFITNYGTNNYNEWKRVDNLYVQGISSTNYFYKFGVLQDTNTCYIEFPENAEELIKSGIYITYIRTTGEEGNVSYKTIEKLYSEMSPSEDPDVLLTTDNIKILNYSAAVDGKNPQTINSAYKGYQSTIGVFDTLVTLRDYTNYILKSGLVSNGFACDRTNDIQSTYKVITASNETDNLITEIEDVPHSAGTPELTAFDLKLYLLQKPNVLMDSLTNYVSTFKIMDYASQENVRSYIEDVKCISHDYTDILPYSDDSCHFCYFENRYPIKCNIVTQYKLTNIEAKELVTNVCKALYEKLNAEEVTFGEEISYEFIQKTILNADKRIKNAILDNIEYTTYAVVYSDSTKRFEKIQVSGDDENPIQIITNEGALFTCTVDETTFTNKVEMSYKPIKFTCNNSDSWTVNGSTQITTEQLTSEYGITLDTSKGNPGDGDFISAGISFKTHFKDEIYAKSILAGTTQFIVQDEEFDYQLQYVYDKYATTATSRIKSVGTNVDVEYHYGDENGSNQYKLKENETIQLFAPNLLDITTYSNYVKFEYRLNNDLYNGENYQLKNGEYFIFYWKEYETDTFYKYAVYGEGNIIQLESFDLPAYDGSNNVGTELTFYTENIGTDTDPVMYTSSSTNNRMTFSLSGNVKKITNTNQILSSIKKINIRELNQVLLESGDARCYWILNEKEVEEDGNSYYKLFDRNGKYDYLLNSGEYFIYTDSSLSNLTILGAGTLIRRTDNSKEWIVSVISDASSIVEKGINAFLEDDWFSIPSDSSVILTEQYYIAVTGKDSLLRLDVLQNRPNYMDAHVESTTLTSADVNSFTFLNFTDGYGKYTFTYNGSSWQLNSNDVNLSDYGITYSGTPSENSNIVVKTIGPDIKIDNESVWNMSPKVVPVLPMDLRTNSVGTFVYEKRGSRLYVWENTSLTNPDLNNSIYLIGKYGSTPSEIGIKTNTAYTLSGCPLPSTSSPNGDVIAAITGYSGFTTESQEDEPTLDKDTFISAIENNPNVTDVIYDEYIIYHENDEWNLKTEKIVNGETVITVLDTNINLNSYGVDISGLTPSNGALIKIKIPFPWRLRLEVRHTDGTTDNYISYGSDIEFTILNEEDVLRFIIESDFFEVPNGNSEVAGTFVDAFPSNKYNSENRSLVFTPLCTLVNAEPSSENTNPEKITLKDFKIAYAIAPDTTSFTEVKQLNLMYDDYTWSARTLLALNISSTLKQILYANQSVIAELQNLYVKSFDNTTITQDSSYFCTVHRESTGETAYQFVTEESGTLHNIVLDDYDADNIKLYVNGKETEFTIDSTGIDLGLLSSQYVIEGHDLTNQVYQTVLLSNPEIITDGGQRVSTFYYDDDLELQFLKFFVFAINMDMGTGVYQSTDGDVNIVFFNDVEHGDERAFNICIPEGDYILPLSVGTDLKNAPWGESDLYITYNGVRLKALNNDSIDNFNEAKDYFVHLISDGEQHELKFKVSDNIENKVTINIANIFRYSFKENMSTLMINKMMNFISKLDKDNLYNYMYKVNPDEEISDPTEGKSFFLTNHIYNSFTIPMMSSVSGINVVGKKG